MPIKTISEGMTNSYLLPALGVLVLGLVSFNFSWMIALPIIACSIGLFASTTGVQINTETKEYRTYLGVYGLKIGSWSSLEQITQITLVLSTERATLRGIMPGAIPVGRSSTVQVRTYDLLINDGINTEELNDFITYKNARKAFDILSGCLNVSSRDLIAEKLASNRAKRSS